KRMYVLLIVAVVAAVAAAEVAPAEPVSAAGARLAIVAGGMLLVALAGAAIAHVTVARLRSDAGRRQRWLKRFERLRTVHAGLWLAATGATLFPLAWPQLVRENWALRG